MPKGPKGEKRPADVVSNAVKVTRIATGEENRHFDRGKDSQFLNDGLWIMGINRGGRCRRTIQSIY